MGITSGRTYSFAERGPEWVTTQPPSSGGGVGAGPDAGQVAVLVASAVARELRNVTVQMDGKTVGVIQGRQADLYSRGG